jgi:hypothetical protein
MRRLAKLAAGLCAAATLAAGQAQAATWLVSYVSTGGNPFAASLTVNTLDALDAVGGYDVTGVSGNVDGDAVTGLIANPGQPFAHLSADGLFIFDNVLFTGAAPVFSNPGLFFSGASGSEYNLFSVAPATFELYKANPGVGYLANSVGQVTAAAAIPEPAAWTMMILGFGLVGNLLRQRRRTRLAIETA